MATSKAKQKPKPQSSPQSAYYSPTQVDDSNYRLSRIEGIIEREMKEREQQQAFLEGIKKGKHDSFWPVFALGICYGIVLIWSLRKSPGEGAKIFAAK